jgi:hypothetical protein
MPNRFIRRIKSGEIDSIEELKSEFKELAKLTHPDIHGPGAEAEFVTVRAEYEAALRGFERRHVGAPNAGASDFGDAWACLGLLLKRGFPKSPRHEKEKLRYEYARWRFAHALAARERGFFEAFEAELLDQKAMGSEALASEMALLRDLLDYRDRGLAPMRTHIVLSLGALKSDPRVGPEVSRFIDVLAHELGLGGEISDQA